MHSGEDKVKMWPGATDISKIRREGPEEIKSTDMRQLQLDH